MGRGASWPDRTGVPVRKGRATGPHRGRPAGQDAAAEGQRRRSCFPSGVGGGLGPPLPPGLGGQPSLPGRGPWVPAGPWRPEVLGVNLHVTRRPRCSASRSFIVPCGHVGRRPRAQREALPPGSTEHGDRLHPVPSPVQPVLGWAAMSGPVPASTRGGEGQSCNLPILGDRAKTVPRTALRPRAAIPASVSDTVAFRSD